MSTINYMESTDCILLSNLAFPVVIKLTNYLVLVGNKSAVCVVAIVQLNIKKVEIRIYIMKEIQPVNAQFYCSNCDNSYMFLLHKVAIFRLCISEV